MIFDSPKLNLLNGGWYAVFKDGSVITEEEMDWLQVPNKRNIRLMGLKRHNKYYEIADKECFGPPGETHCREIIVNPGTEYAVTKQTLVSWNLSYYEGDYKIIMKVSANNRSVTTEKIPLKQELS